MNLAIVKGKLWATIKNDCLTGKKILAIQPVNRKGENIGKMLYALDSTGVGEGETVVYVTGYEASHCFLPDIVATDATIIAKVDRVTCENM